MQLSEEYLLSSRKSNEGGSEKKSEKEEPRKIIRRHARKMAIICALCWFLGVVVFGVVEWVQTDVSREMEEDSLPSRLPHLLLAGAGGSTYVTGVAGYWGSLHCEHGLVCGFSYIVLISGLIEVTLGAISIANSGQKLDLLETINVVKGSFDEQDEVIFELQKQLGCCGSASPSDWVGSNWWRRQRKKQNSTKVVPHSCCRSLKRTKCQEGPAPYKEVHDRTLIYERGCHNLIVRRRPYLKFVCGVVSCLCGVAKLASFFAIHCFAGAIIAKQKEVDEMRQRSVDLSAEMEKATEHYRRRIVRLKEA